jgi:hypothetical protein
VQQIEAIPQEVGLVVLELVNLAQVQVQVQATVEVVGFSTITRQNSHYYASHNIKANSFHHKFHTFSATSLRRSPSPNPELSMQLSRLARERDEANNERDSVISRMRQLEEHVRSQEQVGFSLDRSYS